MNEQKSENRNAIIEYTHEEDYEMAFITEKNSAINNGIPTEITGEIHKVGIACLSLTEKLKDYASLLQRERESIKLRLQRSKRDNCDQIMQIKALKKEIIRLSDIENGYKRIESKERLISQENRILQDRIKSLNGEIIELNKSLIDSQKMNHKLTSTFQLNIENAEIKIEKLQEKLKCRTRIIKIMFICLLFVVTQDIILILFY